MLPLPQFSQINLSAYPAELDTLLDRFRAKIQQLLEQPHYDWQNLMAPMEAMDDQLCQLWSPLPHLHAVVNSEELRAVYNHGVKALAKYSTEMGQNQALYRAIKQVQTNDPIQQKVLKDECQSFELSGVSLAKDKRQQFAENHQRLSQLNTDFETNILDCTNAWQRTITDVSLLKGLPIHALATAQQRGKKAGEYVLTLDFPCFHAVSTFCEDESLRREMHLAFVTRASDQGCHDPRFDNSAIIDDILRLRHEQAQLLGYDNFAELSLVPKMAPDVQTVFDFLENLAVKSYPQARAEFQALTEFAGKPLNPWDIAFYSEKLRQQQFDVSEDTLRPYFPMANVIDGMFKLVTKLYGVTFQQDNSVDLWHKDALFYRIQHADGRPLGGVYMDLFARPNKRGGAWMNDAVSYRELDDGSHQPPIAFLTCNFAPGSRDTQAYLSHDEVVTLFHEFGHCLHHLLTRAPYLSVSGINGVEWDAVELPSQFFEQWAWQYPVLKEMTCHKDTGACLPKALYQKIIAARNFQSGMAMMRQLEFALFDLSIHNDYQPDSPQPVMQTLNRIRKQISVVPFVEENRLPHAFSHVFAGGYAAGYFSYKWAEVLSCDVFAKFQEQGLYDPPTAQSFLDEILSRGSSRDMMTSFIAFRGREPKIDALLQDNGIAWVR